jgi:flavorubredoxin
VIILTLNDLRKDIQLISMKDWDRRLFDELIPLPDGTSYNAYIIRGTEKTVLIDSTDPRMGEDFLQDLKSAGLEKLDFIIANHAEPDHAGLIPKILNLFPESYLICSVKAKEILADLLHIAPERFYTVEDGQTISLGNKTLKFILAPWVHWPETMFTYLEEDKILFTCDFLGNHIATSDIFAKNKAKVYEAAKRYYAEIMMPFRQMIKKHLKKIQELDFEIIATSHGPIYDDPRFILNAYEDWVSDDVKNEVVIPFVSMYGSTEILVNHLVDALIKRGITVKPYRLTTIDIGVLAMSLVDAATIVIGSPTVIAGPHPVVSYAASLANLIRPKANVASMVGSYGWQGKMVDKTLEQLGNLNVEIIPPVIVKGKPRNSDIEKIEQLANDIAEKHKSLGIL